jgi:hypothetical protein
MSGNVLATNGPGGPGEEKSGRFLWVKRGESARCRNGDLVICTNATGAARVTVAIKKVILFFRVK